MINVKHTLKIVALGLMMGSLAYAQAPQTAPQAAGPSAQKIQLIQNSLVDSLNAMKSTYATLYAPKEWKATHLGWDLTTSYQDAIASSQMVTSVREARDVLMKFIYSMKDYHVSISFISTESAFLPFTVKKADGKFFVTFVDRTKMPTTSFPIAVGDEVVDFGGQPTDAVVEAIKAEVTSNVAETDQAMADLNLTRRRASRGYKVPNGSVLIGFKSKSTGEVSRIQLHWDYTAEKINPLGGSDKANFAGISMKDKIANLQMVGGNLEIEAGAENPFLTGTKKSYIPELGTRIWTAEADNEFDAYIAVTATGKRVGVLRISSYVPSTASAGTKGYEEAIADLAVILKKFESDTDLMVIDQINNPGGSVFYLYAIVSMMANHNAMATPKHAMAINPSDIMGAYTDLADLEKVKDDATAIAAMGTSFAGYPVDYQTAMFYKGYLRFLINEWNAGKILTEPGHIAGVDMINPSQVVDYTKPILIVVNELCFSGGDFFPATMQDNKRAKILGVRTAGAGGYVEDNKTANLLGIDSFRVTASIAQRSTMNPIENLGVTPDIAYALTADDLQNGFLGYKAAILNAVSTLVP